MSGTRIRPQSKRFFYLIAAPTVIAVLATALVISGMLFWSAKRANEISYDRQLQLAEVVLGQSVARIVHDQESVTVWDDPILKLREPELDWSWLDDNLGVWLHSYFGHDQIYVLNADNAPIYAMRDGARTDGASYAAVAETVDPLVRSLRRAMRDNPEEGVTETVLSPGAADLAVVDGHPAIVSVKPIVSGTGTIEQEPGTEFLHVSVRFLDGSFIEELARDYLFEGARFAWADESASEERSYPFVARDGQPIGHFIWTPYAPGSTVLKPLIPVLLAALAIVGSIVALLMLRVRRGAMELQASEAQAQHLAFHDTLTGLPNRALFDDRLERALAEVRRHPERHIALLYLDLDRFKQVNDSLGHPAGDELIRELGSRLATLLREVDTVARIGGDEFAVIQTGISSIADTDTLCRRIIESVRAPFNLEESQVFVGITIGVAMAPADALDRIELTRKADIALYHAKAGGRGRYVVFAETMDVSLRQRRTIERDLRAALKAGNQLHVHYQPVYSAPKGEIAGVEALVRWQHPRDGMKSPALFIPIAEESGLIEPLGEWVLAEACTAAARWPIQKVAVNVSAVQLRSPLFAQRVLDILQRTGLQPERLELEITETALMESPDQCAPNIRTLRAAGIRIALDDFGTGYSSLSHIRQFEVDRVKIDRSFVNGIDRAEDSSAIIQAIVDLAQATGLSVTAEGVETQEQSSFLSGIGCNELQGFLLSRPMPVSQMDELMGVQPPGKAQDGEPIAA
jgi:diguanylate cyclase (GGDEF)-like protein